MIDHELREAIESWLRDDPDPAMRAEITRLLAHEDNEALEDRFRSRLEFGTAGLRGLMGAGPNRMNLATVRKVTAGLAAYLLRHVADAAERGVVVAYDARRNSHTFAGEACRVLAGAGIPAYTYPAPVSTPRLGFSLCRLGAAAGVVVTASHNPPAYNGYKVYWENGAQIIPPHDEGISRAIDGVASVRKIPLLEEEAARSRGLWRDVPPDVEKEYVRRVANLCLNPGGAKDFGIVYTPLHGVGAHDMQAVMSRAGYAPFWMVTEQEKPDGEFPTVEFPNPEEPGTLDLALECAAKRKALLVLANDPDADRLAVALRGQDGAYRVLLGNEIGMMMAHYLLRQSKFDKQPLVCTTIVSSSILAKLARDSGAKYAEVLTGFKWIANKAMELEAMGDCEFLFGFEEALGYTVRDLVRDKDGVGAAVVFADLVGWALAESLHPLDYLERIYKDYGFHAGAQESLILPGESGREQMLGMMDSLRREPPTDIAGSAVRVITDFSKGLERQVESGEETPVDLPQSNVLRYVCEDGTRVLVRPSGTEPKIKFYIETVTDLVHGGASQEKFRQETRRTLENFVDDLKARSA